MRILVTLLMAAMMTLLTACGGGGTQAAADVPAKQEQKATTTTPAGEGKRVLVAYFSRADENTGVGWIEKGNTRILAERMHGDLFEIRAVQ